MGRDFKAIASATSCLFLLFFVILVSCSDYGSIDLYTREGAPVQRYSSSEEPSSSSLGKISSSSENIFSSSSGIKSSSSESSSPSSSSVAIQNSSSSITQSSSSATLSSSSSAIPSSSSKAPSSSSILPISSSSNPPSSSSFNIFYDTRDNIEYRYVEIPNAGTWMAENLNHEAKDSKCYDNILENCTKYGRLYDWDMAKGACPYGWHLPYHAELMMLVEMVGDINAGKNLKAMSGWKSYSSSSGNGTDYYGFSALPGGFGLPGQSSFDNEGKGGNWWLVDEPAGNTTKAYYWNINYDANSVNVNTYSKGHFFSVRCIKDK